MSRIDHSEVVNAFYQASVNPELWPNSLAVLADHVGALAGNLVYQAPAGGQSFLVPGRMREDLNALYLEHYTGNPYARAFEKVSANRIVIGNRLVDVEAVHRSAFYADICAPQQIENQIFFPHASLHRPGGIGGVALFLSRRQSEYEKDAAERFQRLAQHLSRAIDFTLLSSQLAKDVNLLERILAVIPDATVLLDRHGGIIQINAAADQLLLKADGIGTTRKERLLLCARQREDSARLSACIRRALAVAGGEDEEFMGTLRLRRPSGMPPFLVLITPLPPSSFSLWDAVDGGARVMVQIVDLQATMDSQAEQLRIIAGLTGAETRVAALIGGGMTASEASATLGISANTMKTHLGRVFAKTGVRSQVALARLVAAIPVRKTVLHRNDA